MKTDKTTEPVEQVRAHILILEARFYADLCDELCRGAIAAIERAGATWERLAVPGALEIPGAIAIAHETGLYHGYVALGCVLRGETTHYDIVANESARGIMGLTTEGLCIGNGILTCENEAQAWA
ncbi:6,7-dimethyl-8-ribityllumazine synthase, partial [Aestuariivirga sp.]|uniref:6,7-dimethyl-8-ribityllumazine synthase n=1 Tax=Aestuariivirga sp. TaxID=2650926 RepID=UPI00391955CE